MHLILMTRGIQQSRDIWKMFMQSQWFNFRQKPILKDAQGNFLKNPDGTYQHAPETMARVQGALRPIELWEYVFPQESLEEVLAMMNLQNSFPLRKEVNNNAWILRKLMGAKQIPQSVLDAIKGKDPCQITTKHVPMNGMAVYPIGIKDDVVQDFTFGSDGFYQEGL